MKSSKFTGQHRRRRRLSESELGHRRPVGRGADHASPERRTDHELELVVIIGKQGTDISADKALDHIAGYCLGLDMVVRGPQDRSLRKSMDGYAVLGPWMVTADEVPNVDDVPLALKVNDELRQAVQYQRPCVQFPQADRILPHPTTHSIPAIASTAAPQAASGRSSRATSSPWKVRLSAR